MRRIDTPQEISPLTTSSCVVGAKYTNCVVGDGSLTEEVICDGGDECRGRVPGINLDLHMFELFVTLSKVDGTICPIRSACNDLPVTYPKILSKLW